MTKADIVDKVAAGTGLTKLETEAIVEGFLKTVIELSPHFSIIHDQDHHMRWAIRIFFRTLRFVLIPFVLLWEVVTTPKGITRAPAEQQRIDEQTRSLALYQFKTCPFCIKVRQEMRRLSLAIERRDAQPEGPVRAELVAGGGRAMVPCLRIAEGGDDVRWLYESGAIIDYLRGRFEQN